MRRIIDHRHDAGVVEPRRPDHAEHADDALLAVAERRRDHRRAGEREELVLRTDEDAHALAVLGAIEDVDHVLLRFEVVEQQADALQILGRLEVAQKIRLSAHDELRLPLAFRPGGEPSVHQLGREFVELLLGGASGRLDVELHLREGAPSNARVEIVRRLDEGRGREVARDGQHPVLDAAILADEHGQRPLRFEPDEFDLFEPGVVLGRDDDPGAPRHARQHGRRLGQDGLETAILRACDLCLDAATLLLVDVADLEQRVDEEA